MYKSTIGCDYGNLCLVVVSNIFYFHPYLGKIPILTNIFQMGWNHQLVYVFGEFASQRLQNIVENPIL